MGILVFVAFVPIMVLVCMHTLLFMRCMFVVFFTLIFMGAVLAVVFLFMARLVCMDRFDSL